MEVLRSVLASWWREARAPDPPARVWRDWVLVGVLATVALLEGALNTQVTWRPFATAVTMALVPVLLWRRTHPLGAVGVAFGTLLVLTAAGLVANVEDPVWPAANAFVLLLPYSLFRWGSGRETVLGLLVMLVTAVLAIAADWTGLVDAVSGVLVLLFPAVVGATVRYQRTARARELEQMKASEREQLARELHDTVAHHVSAIAVRAQAGRVVAQEHPEAALDALGVIEGEASRTLAELRTMVGILREGDHATLAPQRGVADIAALDRVDDPRRVRVTLSGELGNLPPTVDAALYRIAQESITNALQHSKGATGVEVQVTGEPRSVRLSVRDDGSPVPGGRGREGYGLIGMAERAALLGGSLHAGPHPEGGWRVESVIPHEGSGG